MTEVLPTYVVDASVALKWAVRTDEPFIEQADLLLDDYQSGTISLIGPAHLPSEFGHGLVRAVRMGRLGLDSAQEQMRHFLGLHLTVVADGDLFPAAIALAQAIGCSFYDALYVALAQRRGVQLVHADEALRVKLAAAPSTVQRWLGEYRSGTP